MAGKRYAPPPNQIVRGVALENIQDTGATIDNPSAERQSKRQRKNNFEKVDPPFRTPEQVEHFIDWAVVIPALKLVAKIVIPILTFLLPIVWYASKLDSSVGSLQVDVRDIKQKTEDLAKNSIQHNGRLDSLEMTINRNVAFQNPAVITKESGDKDSDTPTPRK